MKSATSRNIKVALFIIGGLLVVLAGFVVDLIADAGGFRTIEPHFSGTCRTVEGIVGAEDIVIDGAARRVYLSNTDWRALRDGRPQKGGIFTYDLDADEPPARVATDMEGPLHAHGLSFFQSEQGEKRLFVVNHARSDTSSVEIFDIEEPARLRHLQTVRGTDMISINDVAAAGLDTFYATNDHGTGIEEAARLVETYGRMPWASVVYFDGQRVKRVAERLTYANGVALSSDGRTLYVAETTGRRLVAYDRDSRTGQLKRRAVRVIPSGLDNIAIDGDGKLWIASHPKMLDFVAHAEDGAKLSPSQVFRLDVPIATDSSFEELYLDSGSGISGSSVALPVGGGRFLVGSVFEPHFLDCRLEQ